MNNLVSHLSLGCLRMCKTKAEMSDTIFGVTLTILSLLPPECVFDDSSSAVLCMILLVLPRETLNIFDAFL